MTPYAAKIAASKRAGRKTAKANGHTLGAWFSEGSATMAMCGCGGYAAIENRMGFTYVSYGKLSVLTGATRPDQQCKRAQERISA